MARWSLLPWPEAAAPMSRGLWWGVGGASHTLRPPPAQNLGAFPFKRKQNGIASPTRRDICPPGVWVSRVEVSSRCLCAPRGAGQPCLVGGGAAPLPMARAALQQPVRKEREKTTVPVCAPDCLCGAVPSPAEASSTPHPTPTAAPHDTQESPPLALEFHSAAVWGPEAQAAVLSGRGWGRPALPGTLAAEWPPRAGLPAHTAHKWVPDPQPPTGSAPCPVCAPERVPAAVGLRGRTLGKRLSVVFLLSVWFWGNFSIFRTESV